MKQDGTNRRECVLVDRVIDLLYVGVHSGFKNMIRGVLGYFP